MRPPKPRPGDRLYRLHRVGARTEGMASCQDRRCHLLALAKAELVGRDGVVDDDRGEPRRCEHEGAAVVGHFEPAVEPEKLGS